MRGHSLLEVLLTVGLLTLLLLATLTIYVVGMRAWVKGDREAERLAATQVTGARLAAELQSSLYSGLEVGPHGFRCLSPRDSDGNVVASQADGLLEGRRHLAFWAADGQLYRRELPGAEPLADAMTDGEPLTRLPAELDVTQEGRLVTLQLKIDGHLSEHTVRVRN